MFETTRKSLQDHSSYNNESIKDISIFQWLNPFNNNNNNSNSEIIKNNNFIKSRGSTPNLQYYNLENNSIEYRGVENLKQFWNNRISLTKDSTNKIKSSTLSNRVSPSKQQNQLTKLTGSKSINCLLSATNCGSVQYNNKFNKFNKIILNKTNSDEHKNIDNFYKYKTAETKKNTTLDAFDSIEQKKLINKTDCSVTGNNNCNNTNNNCIKNKIITNSFGINFPLIATTEKGEKIHWAKRDDIFIARKANNQIEKNFYSEIDHKNNIPNIQNNNNNNNNNNNSNKKIINLKMIKDTTNNIIDDKTISEVNSFIQNNNNNSAIKIKIKKQFKNMETNLVNLNKEPNKNKLNYLDLHINNSIENDIKENLLTDSHNSSNNSLVSSESLLRKKHVGTARKYSFKTHSKSYHNTPRKNYHHQITGSKVAALTQQFNQIIQKDSGILDEIKKKNGVLIATAGHVYKIKEEINKNKKLCKRNASSESDDSGSISKGTAKKKIILRKVKSNDSSVKATIRKFEGTQNHKKLELDENQLNQEKPKIPIKSETVLNRTKEIAIRNLQKKTKPNTLEIPQIQKTLEDIKEEAKTPTQDIVAKTDDNLKEFSEDTSNKVNAINVQKMAEKSNQMNLDELDQCMKIDKNNENSIDKVNLEESDMELSDSPTKKSRYTKIYEKLRIRSTIFSNKKSNRTKQSPETDNQYIQQSDDLKNNSDQRPNNSFLFRPNSKNELTFSDPVICPEEDELIETVNTPLINKIRSSEEITVEAKNDSFIYMQMAKNNIVCDELYEPIESKKTDIYEDSTKIIFTDSSKCEPKSFLFKQIENQKNKLSTELFDDIYQTIADIKDEYEKIEKTYNIETNDLTDDGYEICEPPPIEQQQKQQQIIAPKISESRNTRDELPALPEPKRSFNNNTNLLVIGEPPPRPKKSPLLNRSIAEPIENDIDEYLEDQQTDYCDENIYDTIKGSESQLHCYEMLNGGKNSLKSDNLSNCYETINSIQIGRKLSQLHNSDSISTISSDHKTNSLYGINMNGNPSIAPTENSSDNSDDWIDISDDDNKKQEFIIVRERNKCHRSPDWSKRVRDQRIHKKVESYNDDDSDHYYEPLYPSKEYEKSIKKDNHLDSSIMIKSNVKINSTTILDSNNQHNAYSDDYDSFTDDDETDDDIKKNDSGVDISKSLPEPPSEQHHSTNQVYAFVKKFKNFISNKKSSSKSSPNDIPNGKQYENTQFYVTSPEYQNTQQQYSDEKRMKKKTPKLIKKSLNKNSKIDLYENQEFHSPIILSQKPKTIIDDINNKNLIQESSLPLKKELESTELINRRKSKSEKSFKAKLRKSLINSTNNEIGTLTAARSTFYIADSNDYDSGIFEKSNQASNETMSLAEKTDNNTLNAKTCSQTLIKKSKRNHRSPELNRRKTIIGIRPHEPPPPPPVDRKISLNNGQKRNSATSWYAECGVFKANGLTNPDEQREYRGDRTSNTSWYADAGLYQTSGASVASSSGSSGVSTGGEGGPSDENSHSMFLNEPLYQIYSAAKLESISRDMEDQESTDGYEEIGVQEKKNPRPTALQLVGPRQGPSRTLWSEIPEVINSGVLSTLTQTEKRLQEAKFEILTSEASYLKSLNLLKTHFMNHPAFRDANILHPSDRKALFAQIIPVHQCSDRLLCDLESCWQDNIMLRGLSKNIYKNAEKYLHVYISFCEHQGKMDRTLRKLKEQKGQFSQILETLESDALCCGLNLHSFLMLPMQRITRLPLLIEAVFSKVKADDDEYEDWKITLAILNKIVAQCNEAANRCEQAYEIDKLSRQIEFPSNIRSIPIAPVGITAVGSKPRTLIKRGELTQLIWRRNDEAKLTFGKKFTKSNIYAFLFTDLLILTKRKNDEQFTVFDYCSRIMLTIQSGDTIPQLPLKDVSQVGKNLIMMTLLENHDGKTVEMILSCPSVSEQTRWLEATAPPEPETPGEKLYEQWDCPQVIAKHEYIATEPDLLSLEAGDVVNVHRKMPDGWYQGERIRDGMTGWFPGNFTEEVNSAHVRARNLKTRYRLLTFTATYLEQLQKKKKI